MSDPFLGEIELFAFAFAPKGWATCSGQTMPINQNQALFSLLGTTYGGDGRTTFALPDLRGRVAVGQGQGAQLSPRAIGDIGGEESHGLTAAELPAHTHAVGAVGRPSSTAVIGPAGNLLSVGAGRNSGGEVSVNVYGSGTPGVGGVDACIDDRGVPWCAGAFEHDAVLGGDALHRPRRHLPVAQLVEYHLVVLPARPGRVDRHDMERRQRAAVEVDIVAALGKHRVGRAAEDHGEGVVSVAGPAVHVHPLQHQVRHAKPKRLPDMRRELGWSQHSVPPRFANPVLTGAAVDAKW